MRTLILILLACIIYLGFRLATVKDQVQSKEQVIKEKNGTVRTWKDKAGRFHAEKVAAEVTINDLKQELDSVEEVNKHTQSYTGVKTKTEDSIEAEIKWRTDTIKDIRIDTMYVGTFQYNDKWSDFNGTITHDKISLNYSVGDSIELLTELKSQGWFKPRQLYVEGISHNKNTKITWIRNYTRTISQDRFVVVAGTGGALTTNGFIFTPLSITAGIKIFGF